MENKLRLYPRGFLGGDISPQVERTKEPFKDEINSMRYSVNQHNSSGNSIVANPHVEALYAALIKNNIKINDPTFRTKILTVAMTAFGTNNFLIWVLSQYNSPAASDLHNNFILDTLHYIEYGSRDMSLENWMALLTITDEGNNIGTINDKVKEFFGVNKDAPIGLAKLNIQLVDIIQKWCSKPNGLEDLIGTLHILFGNP